MAKDNKGRFKVERKLRNMFIQNEYELSLIFKVILWSSEIWSQSYC